MRRSEHTGNDGKTLHAMLVEKGAREMCEFGAGRDFRKLRARFCSAVSVLVGRAEYALRIFSDVAADVFEVVQDRYGNAPRAWWGGRVCFRVSALHVRSLHIHGILV